MSEPESYAPEGGWMGVTLHQTEIDLEDTSARMSRYEDTLKRVEALAAAVVEPSEIGGHDAGLIELLRHIQKLTAQALNPD